MKSIEERLRDVGLSEKAAKVYIALLQLGSATVQDVATRAKLVRTTCYPILEELETQNLVSTTRQGSRKIYVAQAPDALEQNLTARLTDVRRLLPDLNTIFSGNGIKPAVEVYEGIEGVWNVYEDVIGGSNYEVRSFMPGDDVAQTCGERSIRDYIYKRTTKNISVRSLMQDTQYIKETYSRHDASELRRSRYIDASAFPMPVEIDLYPPHNVAITSFKDEMGLIIRSVSIYQALGSIFEHAWVNAQK